MIESPIFKHPPPSNHNSSPQRKDLNPQYNTQARRYLNAKQRLQSEISLSKSLVQKWILNLSQSKNQSLYDDFIKKEEQLLNTRDIHRPSLLSSVQDIKQVMENNQIINIVHLVGRSQLFQLILGFLVEAECLQNQMDIVLYTSRSTIQNYKYFCNVADNFKNILLNIPKFKIIYFEDESENEISHLNSRVFVDLFYCSELLYLEHLNSIVEKQQFQDLIIYSQTPYPVQIGEQVRICNNFSADMVNSARFQDTIQQILNKSKLYAQKADIIIFSPNSDQESLLIKGISRKVKQPVNIVTGCEQYDDNLTNIFIAVDEKQLSSWQYSYDHVISVLDYGVSVKTYFSYSQKAFVQKIDCISQDELMSRLSFLGRTKPGKYFKMFQNQLKNKEFIKDDDLSVYVLKMIQLKKNKEQMLENKDNNIKNTIKIILETLLLRGIIQERKPNLYDYSKELKSYYCCPLVIQILNKLRSNPSEANFFLYIVSILNFYGSIKTQQSKILSKSIYKEGDVSFFAQIMYLYESELKKDNSKQNLTKLINQFGATQSQVIKYLRIVDTLRQIYDIKHVESLNFKEDISKVFMELAQSFSNICTYTGSRKLGYRSFKGGNYSLELSNIFSVLGQRPTYLFPTKLLKQYNKDMLIKYSEKISEQKYIMIVGQNSLSVRKSSIDDKEIEFPGLSNAMVEKFWNTPALEQFQKQNNCNVELKKEENAVVIYSNVHLKEKVEDQFRQLMKKLDYQLEIETRTVNYNLWKLVIEKGGLIKEILNSQQYKSCDLINISIHTPNEKIIQFLEEYADFQKITITEGSDAKSKVAHLTFTSSADLRWVVMELNHYQFDGKILEFVKTQNLQDEKRLMPENNIHFKWYAWPLTKAGVGIVHFKTHQEAIKATQAFSNQFDSKKVTASVQQNRLHLSGLNEHTDQIYLLSRLSVYGQIEHIQLQKQRTQEFNNAERMIEFLIHENINRNERIHIEYVKKMGDGFRIAKVKVFNSKLIPTLCNALNQSLDSLGKTRLYLQPQHTMPILIRDAKIKKIYEMLLHQSIQQLNLNLNSVKIDTVQSSKSLYFVVETNNYDALMLINNLFMTKLKGRVIKLTSAVEDIIFSDMGASLLVKIEQEQECKFIVHSMEKYFGVLCKSSDYDKIANYMEKLFDAERQETMQCSTRTFKIVSKNTEILSKLKAQNNLKNIFLDKVSKTIFIEGSVGDIIKTKQALFNYFESSNEASIQSAGVCGICCQYLNNPYKLQSCSHSFCEECLLFSINNSFSDISCFPLKCPHCLDLIVVEDLYILLDSLKWSKLVDISLNQFVTSNGDVFKFCITPNCEGICLLKKNTFECRLCQKVYCNLCNMEDHPECTCYEAKIGFIALLKKFIEDNDVRTCPNPKCRMLMQKISGCAKVLCSRCNKSVCWSCPKDKMLFYHTPRECYTHLNEVHGGY